MRKTKVTSLFKKELKNFMKKYSFDDVITFFKIIDDLRNNIKLDPKFCDHSLTGDMKDFRECHVKPNLLLVYMIDEKDTLRLARLNSHPEIFK